MVMNLNLENYGFFIVVEFVERKIGFVKLVFVTSAEAERLTDVYFDQFERFSLGSSLSFLEELVEPFTQYECKYHEYLELVPEKSKILRDGTLTSNGDLTVTVMERVEKISIQEFIAWRNLPMYFGFALN